MKKSIICIFATLIIVLSMNIVSFAAYYGDVNNDGKITASDARTILRVSAKLEQFDNEKLVFADVNADGKITASDARTVLRMSAKLEQLIELTTKAPETQPATEPSETESDAEESSGIVPDTEETTTEIASEEFSEDESSTEELTTQEPVTDEPSTKEPETHEPVTEEPATEEPTTEEPTTEEPTTEEPATEEPATDEEVSYPDDIEAFLSGTYYIVSEKTDDDQKVKIAVSGSDAEIAVTSGDAQISVLKKAAETFIKAISAAGEKYYVKISELMKDIVGYDFEALTSRFDFSAYSEKGDAVVSKTVENDVEYDVYSFENSSSVLNFYVTNGNVVRIENHTADGEYSFDVEEMSGTIPSDMLVTGGFSATQIEIIPFVVPEFSEDSSAHASVKTYPVAIKAFLTGKYYLSGTLYDGAEHSFSYAYNGTEKAVAVDGVSYFIRNGISYVRNDEFFVQLEDDSLSGYGVDFNGILDDNTFELNADAVCTAFEKSTFDGADCDVYTMRDKNGNVVKFTIVNERLARLAVLDKDGNEVKYVVADEFADDIPENHLSLIGYKRGTFEQIFGVE